MGPSPKKASVAKRGHKKGLSGSNFRSQDRLRSRVPSDKNLCCKSLIWFYGQSCHFNWALIDWNEKLLSGGIKQEVAHWFRNPCNKTSSRSWLAIFPVNPTSWKPGNLQEISFFNFCSTTLLGHWWKCENRRKFLTFAISNKSQIFLLNFFRYFAKSPKRN